jgi:putative endonuclease
VARNWRCQSGEIDVVAEAPGLLVFCEVKTRRGDGYGSPAAAVTAAKQAHLRRLAASYLAGTPHRSCRVRFDVVTVVWPRRGTPAVEHLEGVF